MAQEFIRTIVTVNEVSEISKNDETGRFYFVAKANEYTINDEGVMCKGLVTKGSLDENEITQFRDAVLKAIEKNGSVKLEKFTPILEGGSDTL